MTEKKLIEEFFEMCRFMTDRRWNTNPDRAVQELALVHLLPAGYEIINTRLGGAGDASSSFKYQDIRDDRVMTYFDLARGAAKTVSFTVNRVYAGSFFRPAIRAYAMYDESIAAISSPEGARKAALVPWRVSWRVFLGQTAKRSTGSRSRQTPRP
jgi:hypothetical protein